MALVEAQGLTKTFGKLEAVKDASFACKRGQCLGLLGTYVNTLL